jgi:aminomuconate-semialdehyde/2-hydroxymuconate-6-semialdehyde dehydrogenase
LRYLNYINGRFVEGIREFDDTNPADGSILAQVSEAGPHNVDEAVRTARAAQGATWGRLGPRERAALLRKIADGIERRFSDFVAAEVADTGKPIGLASRIDIPRAIGNFRFFASLVEQAGIDAYETDLPGRRALNYAVRQPVGVVAVITPWNLPLLLLTWKVAPALACGNTVVAKPSEETPGSTTLLAEVMQEADVPEGVYNVLHGFGPGSAGESLVSHPGIDAISFTGESQTGAAILRGAASTIKRVSLELGGKNPAIVFADCDFEATVRGVSEAVFTNTGQVCLCAERIYVERPIFEEFTDALKTSAESLRLGWPNDPTTTTGPLISREHRRRVASYFDLAVEEGAKVVTGAGIPRFGDARDCGSYITPAIWTGLAETARCVRDEVFGPVCHIAPFDSADQAIRMANDTPYGLSASVWTSNLRRGHAVAKALKSGITWVNCWFLRDLRTAFGGAGLSGLGREGGRHSLEFYSELNNICIHLGEEP